MHQLYDNIFDKDKEVKFLKKKLTPNGAVTGDEIGWVTINPDGDLANFIGTFLPSQTELFSLDWIKITPKEEQSHDGTIVELHGKKYLLTEVKDIP